MVDFGKLARRAKVLTDQHGDKIAKGVDKVADVVDERTKGKHKDKLAKVREAATKLDRTGPATADDPTEGATRPTGGGPAEGLGRS